MKKQFTCALLTAALAVSLAACSADRTDPSTSPSPSANPSSSPAATPTPTPTPIPVTPMPGNDAMNGGGAGGTNDRDNDGVPDIAETPSPCITGDIGDMIENAENDAARARVR